MIDPLHTRSIGHFRGNLRPPYYIDIDFLNFFDIPQFINKSGFCQGLGGCPRLGVIRVFKGFCVKKLSSGRLDAVIWSDNVGHVRKASATDIG